MLLTAKRADVGDYVLDLIILEGTPPGWHQRRFADGSAAILDHLEQVIIRQLGHIFFVGVVPGLRVEGGGRWAIPLSRLAMARGTELSIELFPRLDICSMRREGRAKHHSPETYKERCQTTCTLHCCTPPSVVQGRHASIQAHDSIAEMGQGFVLGNRLGGN
jgi:hypothetical protein